MDSSLVERHLSLLVIYKDNRQDIPNDLIEGLLVVLTFGSFLSEKVTVGDSAKESFYVLDCFDLKKFYKNNLIIL